MRLYCKAVYHNGPQSLHFSAAGIIEVDDPKAEFLLRDAPENFSRELPTEEESVLTGRLLKPGDKGFDSPPLDKAMKGTRVTKKANPNG